MTTKADGVEGTSDQASTLPDSVCPSCHETLTIGSWPFCGPGGHGGPRSYTAVGTDRVYFHDIRMEGEPAVTSWRQHEKMVKAAGLEFAQVKGSNFSEF